MNLRDLKYLVAVAERRHFGKAADACHVSQPTLSTQIKKLEEELGVVLLERTNRQVMLTPVGERIVAQAQRVLREVDDLVHTAEQFRDPFGGEFRLGLIPTVAPYLLPRILGPIRKSFPNLKIRLTEGQTAVVGERLRAGDLDAVILALPLEEENVVEAELYREPFYFAASKNHPKAGKREVALSDLDQEQVLLLEDGHCLRDQALEVCNSQKAADVGITLMPELAIPQKHGAVRYIPFKGNGPHRRIGLCWRGSSSRAALLHDMAGVLREVMAGG
jgi:LysR family hydrogen peroxide-inducible transcriptional activator